MTEEQLRSYPRRVREAINAWCIYGTSGSMSDILRVKQPKRGHYLIEIKNHLTDVVCPSCSFYVHGYYETFEEAYEAHWRQV